MKKYILIALIFVFVLSACTAASNAHTTEEPSTDPTQRILPTQSPEPTATKAPTNTPTPLPTPIAGGGKIYVAFDHKFFTVNPDGSDLTRISGWPLIVSPDSGRMLTSTFLDSGLGPVNLMNKGGLNPVVLIKDPVLVKDSIWLSDGRFVFLAAMNYDGLSGSIYVVNEDGSNLVKLKLPDKTMRNGSRLLFASKENDAIYWVAGDRCVDRGVCNERYYKTMLDDSEQVEIWKNIKAASTNISISPSGEYMSFQTFFGGDAASSKKNKCYISSLQGDNITEIGPFYTCFGVEWKPGNDMLLKRVWTDSSFGLELVDAKTGVNKQLPFLNVKQCGGNIDWLSQDLILLSYCVDAPTFEPFGDPFSIIYLGSRLLDISREAVIELPDLNGSCQFIEKSPDSQWVVLSYCYTSALDNTKLPTRILNIQTREVSLLFPSAPIDYPEIIFAPAAKWLP